MHAIRVYVDTSVFGGAEDAEFAETSRRFFQEVHLSKYIVVLSKLVLDELTPAPHNVFKVLQDLPKSQIEFLEISEEMESLAEAYLSEHILPVSMKPDALHVAAATVARASLVLSWNFKHIVNFQRIQRFNAVNLNNGYGLIDIRSPLEIAYDA